MLVLEESAETLVWVWRFLHFGQKVVPLGSVITADLAIDVFQALGKYEVTKVLESFQKVILCEIERITLRRRRPTADIPPSHHLPSMNSGKLLKVYKLAVKLDRIDLIDRCIHALTEKRLNTWIREAMRDTSLLAAMALVTLKLRESLT